MKLLSQKECAEVLGIAESTLRQWRYEGHGPPFVRIGKAVRYRVEAVESWVLEQEQEAADAVD